MTTSSFTRPPKRTLLVLKLVKDGVNVRAIEVEAENKYALRGSALKNALEEDIKRGKHPFILIATLGTTSSGALDNMQEIREVAKDYPSLWIHVDAAWAGVALSCTE